MAWILVLSPPLDCARFVALAVFLGAPGAVLVRAHDGAIDHGAQRNLLGLEEGP
jgi:hypothetical protein